MTLLYQGDPCINVIIQSLKVFEILAIFSGMRFLQPLTQNLLLKASFQKNELLEGLSILFKPAIRTRCYCTLYLDTKFQYLQQKEHSWRTEGIIYKCNYSILFWFSLINLPDCKVKLNEFLFTFKLGLGSNITSFYFNCMWKKVVSVYS